MNSRLRRILSVRVPHGYAMAIVFAGGILGIAFLPQILLRLVGFIRRLCVAVP